jgi:AcrR family transcriptional regulator
MEELSKAERTRNYIIETTAGIFNTKGYAATSMSDITEATGLTKGSIYGNFENKDEVALAVFDHNYNKVWALTQQQLQAVPMYYDKLMVFARLYSEYSNCFPNGGCPILNTAIEADDTHPWLREKAAGAIQKWKKTIEDIIKKGIQAGEFKEGMDHSQLALSMIALIEGGIMISKVTNSPGNLKKVLNTVAMLINGIRK